MKKALHLILIVLIIGCYGAAQEKRVQISFFGGVNHVFEYGSVDDYVSGENDFPAVPSHTPSSYGAAFVFFFSDSVGIEFDGRYITSSKVILEDPSDQDTVEVDTLKRYSATANLLFQIPSGYFRPYLCVGGGIDKIQAEDQTYTSDYGYEIEFSAPERTLDPLFQAGGGVHFLFSEDFGVKIDARYVHIFSEPNAVKGVNAVAGLLFKF
jgi:outer membrane protein W